MIKQINFSNQFFKAEYIENSGDFAIKNYGILVNLDEEQITINKQSSLGYCKSYLLKNYRIQGKIKKAILVGFNFDPAKENKKLNKFCIENWDSNKKRYPEDPSKWHFKILRSPIEKIGNIEFNCWFLPKNTASSIHIEHLFEEVHTQIYGLGIMNKFKKQNYETVYQRMYMPPGFTHDFFFDEKRIYPWHQYEAVTSCIWLAIMKY